MCHDTDLCGKDKLFTSSMQDICRVSAILQEHLHGSDFNTSRLKHPFISPRLSSLA
jgi:hypothetical protein